jgi:hypothetical protein
MERLIQSKWANKKYGKYQKGMLINDKAIPPHLTRIISIILWLGFYYVVSTVYITLHYLNFFK